MHISQRQPGRTGKAPIPYVDHLSSPLSSHFPQNFCFNLSLFLRFFAAGAPSVQMCQLQRPFHTQHQRLQPVVPQHTDRPRPPGGLKKPGLIRFNRLALLETTELKPSNFRLSGYSSTLSSHTIGTVFSSAFSASTRSSTRIHRYVSIIYADHFGDCSNQLIRFVPAGASCGCFK
jgi:hypothetical protein